MIKRPRRLRVHPEIRELVSENSLSISKIIFPVFVKKGKGLFLQNKSLPVAYTLSPDRLIPFLKELHSKGLASVLLFGVSENKDARGSDALLKDSIIIHAIDAIKSKIPNLLVMTDIALDPYTDHGHDGIYKNGKILNDETLEVLSEMSTLHAKAGVDLVAPSDMMDGRVKAIRQTLDRSGFENTGIMAYTAKYASCLYGPFRDVLSAEVQGDKKTYQMDFRNRREALRELKLDLEEGADIVMVKPASWYLDIVSDFKTFSDVPVAAYQVSGECSLIELGAKAGLFDRDRGILESTRSIVRAGADLIATYFAEDLIRILAK